MCPQIKQRVHLYGDFTSTTFILYAHCCSADLFFFSTFRFLQALFDYSQRFSAMLGVKRLCRTISSMLIIFFPFYQAFCSLLSISRLCQAFCFHAERFFALPRIFVCTEPFRLCQVFFFYALQHTTEQKYIRQGRKTLSMGEKCLVEPKRAEHGWKMLGRAQKGQHRRKCLAKRKSAQQRRKQIGRVVMCI